TFARQKKLGVVPADCELTKRPAEIPAWDSFSPGMQRVLARQMEIYAGFLEYADYEAGRLLDTIAKLEALDNTLVYYIIGDNGASGEGTPQGTFSEMIAFNGASALETDAFLTAHLDKFGTPEAYNHYAVGWAHAMDTPYQWTKQVASHWGGTRNGTIVRWPRGIKAKGEIRHQFHHVIDVAPTVLDAASLPEPVMVEGVAQVPLQGVTMRYSFDDANAPERRETQYFEMFGNRGIYHKGWTAVTRHRTPWILTGSGPAFDDDVWELYDTTKDWSQAHDLAKQMPDKLHELQRLFIIEATRYNVLPLDDRAVERANSDMAGRPVLIRGTKQLLAAGMGGLNENGVLNLKNKSYSITAQLVAPTTTPPHGVILSQGGRYGGWGLYAKSGVLTYRYNFLGLESYVVTSTRPIPAGEHQVRIEFAYDGGGLGKGGTVTLYIDGDAAGSGRVEQSMAMVYTADETSDVGRKFGTPISEDMPLAESTFTGTIKAIEINIGPADHDHLVKEEDVVAILMAHQ
ncbi:MAG: sulfatase-like hydrolase/transferase, partial [Candidatus Eremiobacteraeota bacterium]|nr:sulfatase-like hydrolase/transferase [Candidatus Eremiobacteraeota bacterium]